MTRATPPRRTPASAGRTPPAKRPPAGIKPGTTQSSHSFNPGLRQKNGAFNWNRLIVYLLVVVALIMLSFPFWRGFVFRDPVDMTFAALTPEQRTFLRTLPEDQQVMLKEMVATSPARTGDILDALQQQPVQWQETLPSGKTTVFGFGTFNRLDALRGAEGNATIYHIGSLTYLRLENFQITHGPSLHLFLSPELNPTQETSMSNARDIGELKGTAGNIIYPVDFNLAGYQSVVIYDTKYNQLYSAASLTYR